MPIIPLYKPQGATPLQTWKDYVAEHPELKEVKVTYAGRLDPLAEGVVMYLTGEDVHHKPEWLKKDKEYVAEILVGVATDAYDVLGVAASGQTFTNTRHCEERSNPPTISAGPSVTAGDCFVVPPRNDVKPGVFLLPFPPYSSYKIQGKPLFQWAREGRLDEIDIPTKKMVVKEVEVLDERSVSSKELQQEITEAISTVKGDFRQQEILDRWSEVLEDNENNWPILKVRFVVSSGTYIRALAHKLGQDLGTGACLLSLKRTRVGDILSPL